MRSERSAELVITQDTYAATATNHYADIVLPAALWADEPSIGMKIINSSLANMGRDRPRAQGLTILFDRDSARPVAILEAAYLSALRTSAYTALSVLLFGAEDLAKIAVIGCGTLGESHIRLLDRTFSGLQFSLYDHSEPRRNDLVTSLQLEGFDCRPAASAEAAIRYAQIVITTTTTVVGYIPFSWLAPGALVAHVSLDDVLPEVVHRADLVVVDDWHLVSTDERRLLGRMYRQGDLRGPQGEAHVPAAAYAKKVDATLADVLVGRHPGRTAAEQVVLSNPFGMGILDVALGAAVLHEAERKGIGLLLPR